MCVDRDWYGRMPSILGRREKFVVEMAQFGIVFNPRRLTREPSGEDARLAEQGFLAACRAVSGIRFILPLARIAERSAVIRAQIGQRSPATFAVTVLLSRTAMTYRTLSGHGLTPTGNSGLLSGYAGKRRDDTSCKAMPYTSFSSASWIWASWYRALLYSAVSLPTGRESRCSTSASARAVSSGVRLASWTYPALIASRSMSR